VGLSHDRFLGLLFCDDFKFSFQLFEHVVGVTALHVEVVTHIRDLHAQCSNLAGFKGDYQDGCNRIASLAFALELSSGRVITVEVFAKG
jgi:hypothetical protein